MSTFDQDLIDDFRNKEFAHSFMNELINAYIATQIKALRDQRDWTQAQLAKEAKIHQERISVLENVNYSSWTLATLRDIAKAFDLVPIVSFESFSRSLPMLDNLCPEVLERISRKDDLFPTVTWQNISQSPEAGEANPQPQPRAYSASCSPFPKWAAEGASISFQ